ncbi:transcriptional regulator, LysR family [Paracoccus thiocyanatus]|uniref:HTH-type transcriptional regulator CbbR n=1 Tax=Paracoccus thiocyanatus TaxID=34006 RepID=A0A1N6YMU5_9RHOB|nr:LysR family transcriptional regulator [Paracoccus thiocyanatus]SIR15877.1 transcriptional regulator, LysR family [Paracoccus thiocyanatus]
MRGSGLDEAGDKITLRQMQIFLAAVECRSFIRAAEKLSLSPPAVSMQMSRLAEALGATLFVKDGRSVQPTQTATALVPYAERLAETLREAVHVVEQMQGRLDNQVRVAMVSTARNFGPHLVQQFLRQRPAAQVEISIANRDGVIAQLQEDRADLALMGRPPRRIEVTEHQFAKHPYVLIGNPEHPLTRFRRIRRADLVMHRFLVRESGSGTRMVHEHFFHEAGLPLPPAQEMDSNANIKQAVMANMGLAFLSAHTIALERQAGKLSVLSVEGMPQLRDWFVVYPRRKTLGPAAREFRDFVTTDGPAFMRQFFGEE